MTHMAFPAVTFLSLFLLVTSVFANVIPYEMPSANALIVKRADDPIATTILTSAARSLGAPVSSVQLTIIPNLPYKSPYSALLPEKTISFVVTNFQLKNPMSVAPGDTIILGLANPNQPSQLVSLTTNSKALYFKNPKLSSDSKLIFGQIDSVFFNGGFGLSGQFSVDKSIDTSNLKAVMLIVKLSPGSSKTGQSFTSLPPILCDPYTDTNCLENNFQAYLPRPEFSFKDYRAATPAKFLVAAIALRKMNDNGIYEYLGVKDDSGSFMHSAYWEMFARWDTYNHVSNFSTYLKGRPVVPMYPDNLKVRSSSMMKMNWYDSSTTVTDKAIQQFLISNIQQAKITFENSRTSLTNIMSMSGADIIIPIHLGPGLNVISEELGGTTCTNICAYHSFIDLTTSGLSSSLTGGRSRVYYFVIPYADKVSCTKCNFYYGSPAKSIKVMTYHELTETMVQAALLDNYIPNLAEIADPCAWQSYTSTSANGRNEPVTLQKLWSFQQKGCVIVDLT